MGNEVGNDVRTGLQTRPPAVNLMAKRFSDQVDDDFEVQAHVHVPQGEPESRCNTNSYYWVEW